MLRKMMFGEGSLVRSQSIQILSTASVLRLLICAVVAMVAMNCGHAASAATLQVTTAKLPAGYVGLAYSAKLAATGGSAAGYTWSISTGALPNGLTLAPSTGLISGKPTVTAVTAFTLSVKDSAAHTATAKLALTVYLPLTVSTTKLATGYLNLPYSATLTATGGSSIGHKWSISAGTLPPGIGLAAATGIISGKPTATGSSAITVKVTDSLANTATAKLTLLVNPDLTVTTAKLGGGYVGTAYKATLAASGGSGSGNTWSVSTGTLPAGLTLAAATGIISGTPTTAGTSTFSVSVKDSAGNTATGSLKLIVGSQLVISPATLPVGYIDTNYTFTFNAAGGSGTGLVWTTKSTLPQNMVLSKAGVLSGMTPAADSVTLTVLVTDSAKNTASAEFTLVINSMVAQCTNDHQTTALVELHGLYTFTLNRRNLSNGQLSNTIGSFNADGLGNILNGAMDSNGPEFTAELQNTFTGTYTVGSDGRGRMSIIVPSTGLGVPTLSQSFCFALDTFSTKDIEPPYNVDNKSTTYGASTHAFVIENDPTITSSGEFLAQTVNPTNLIMKGSWAFALAGRVHYPTLLPNGPDPRVTFVGYISCDGNGQVTAGEVDEDLSLTYAGKIPNPTYTSQKSLLGTYSIPTPSSGNPTGRGTTSLTDNGADFADYVFYPVGSSGFVAMVTKIPASTTPVHIAWTGVGARRTSTSFSTASLKGSSVASQYFIENPGLSNESEGVGIDVDHWNGFGSFTYTGDRNSASIASTVSGSGTYTIDANGRFAVMVNGLCAPCGYLSGTNQGFAIYDSEDTALVTLDAQVSNNVGQFDIASMILGGYSFGSRWYVFPHQQTASGETITKGDGNFIGTLDTDTQGETAVDLNLTAVATSTSSSSVSGRFLYQPNNSNFRYALYVIDFKNAVAIPLGGSNSETETLLRFIHQ
jgi:hypothetical protein